MGRGLTDVWLVGTATFQPDIPWDTLALVLGLIVATFLLVTVFVIVLLRRVASTRRTATSGQAPRASAVEAGSWRDARHSRVVVRL